MTDEGMAHIATMEKLRRVSLEHVWGIRDEHFRHLQELPHLREVNLHFLHGLSYKALERLQKVDSLHVLSVVRCGDISKGDIQRFRSARPDVMVYTGDERVEH
jgi:hypothetical protein